MRTGDITNGAEENEKRNGRRKRNLSRGQNANANKGDERNREEFVSQSPSHIKMSHLQVLIDTTDVNATVNLCATSALA